MGTEDELATAAREYAEQQHTPQPTPVREEAEAE